MSPGMTPGAVKAIDSARRYVDEVCHFDTADFEPWHFARARNASLGRATAEYVFILDDDEYLTGAEWAGLREALRTRADAYMVTVHNILEQGTQRETAVQIRILRNCPEYRYRGEVHHQLTTSPERVEVFGAAIVHTGYDLPEEETVAKYAKRLTLYDSLLSAEKAEKRRLYYQYQRAVCLYMCRRHEEVTAAMPSPDLLGGFASHAAFVLVKSHLALLRGGQKITAARRVECTLLASGLYALSGGDPIKIGQAALLALMMGCERDGVLWMCRAYLSALEGHAVRRVDPAVVREALASVLEVGKRYHAAARLRRARSPKKARRIVESLMNEAA